MKSAHPPKDYSDMSYVSLAQQQCVVCGTVFETGEILLDKRLKPSMHKHTVTGLGMCPEHQKLKDDGYVAVIEADEAKHGEAPRRLGRIAHIRGSVWGSIFNSPAPPKGVAFAGPSVLDLLTGIDKQSREAIPAA